MAEVTTTFRLLRRRRAARPMTDFADYGTAFGLDMSLLPEEEYAATTAAARPARDPGWWRRLMQRKRPTSP